MSENHIPYETLIAYAAREMSEVEFALFAPHFSVCPVCAATVQRYKNAGNILRGDFSKLPSRSVMANAKQIFVLERQFTPWSARPKPSIWGRTRRISFSGALMAVLLAAMFTIGGVSAVGAQAALPGDVLYPVKIATESLQLALTVDEGKQAEIHSALILRRVNEIDQLVVLKRYQDIPASSANLQVQVEEAIAVIDRVARQDSARANLLSSQLEIVLIKNEQMLTNLATQIPESAKPALQDVIGSLDKHKQNIIDTLPIQPTFVPPASQPYPLPTITITPTPVITQTPLAEETSTKSGKTQQVTDVPPGKFITPGKDDKAGPPQVPPGQNKSAEPPGQDKNTPPGQNDKPLPPGQSKPPPPNPPPPKK